MRNKWLLLRLPVDVINYLIEVVDFDLEGMSRFNVATDDFRLVNRKAAKLLDETRRGKSYIVKSK